MPIRYRIEVENADQVAAQLAGVTTKLRNRTVKRAVTAAAKVTYKEAQRVSRTEKVTGFFARSIKLDTKTRRGKTTAKIGQEKQRTFKARKSLRAKGKNLSQIQRAGKAVPIHWLERGTKPHTISAAGKGNTRTYSSGSNQLAFRVGRKLVFAARVSNPGTGPKRILERTANNSRNSSAEAFKQVVSSDLSSV